MRIDVSDASSRRFPSPNVTAASADPPEPWRPENRLVAGFIGAPSRIPSALSELECNAVIRVAATSPVVVAGLVRPIEGYRQGAARELTFGSETAWLYRRISDLFEVSNQWYRYRIAAIAEPLLYCEYLCEGKFDWHVDCGEAPTGTRKLSLSIQLSGASEYEGGGLEFAPNGELHNARSVGTAVVFPSFTWHRITSVAWGVRRSLVAWAHGPTFS